MRGFDHPMAKLFVAASGRFHREATCGGRLYLLSIIRGWCCRMMLMTL